MIRSSFASFSTARLGMMANQSGLDITAQNLTNMKTFGYTRQRLNQLSLGTGSPNLYNTISGANIGYGVHISGASQYRDPFLDTRYRYEMSNLSTADKKLGILKDLESRLDEIGAGKEALAAQLSELHSSLQALQAKPGDVTADNQVRAAAQSIVEYLNLYSNQLSDLKGQTVTGTEKDITNVNSILTQIQEMNVAIKNSQTNGMPALELQDQRNLLLDSLSTYGKVNITYTSNVSNSGAVVESLNVTLTTENGNRIPLINNTDPPAVFELATDATGEYQVNITPSGSNVPENNVQFTGGAFKSSLSMLNSSGNFDGTTVNGIGYYQKMIDEFAGVFATTLNEINNLNGALTDQELFESSDGNPITAGNIKISDGWLNGTVRITSGSTPGAPSGDNGNILNMINALNGSHTFSNAAGGTVFEGSFQECLENFRNVLSTDTKAAETTTKNYLSLVNEAGNARDSVSGVSLDEETVNMMTYNKAFAASARLISTLDEMLNTVLGMGAS